MLIIVLQVFVGLFFDIPLVYYGPFQNLKNLVVTTAMTTLHHQYLATAFLSNDEITKIMAENKVDDYEEKTNSDEIVISENTNTTQKDIEVIDVSKGNYKAYLMVIKDPKKVVIGTTSKVGGAGLKLKQIISNYNAIAGINAGGFSDNNGKGNGGTPIGFLISHNELIYGSETGRYCVVGFNQEDKLILGYYTLNQVKKMNYRDAATFGPILVVNGKPTIKSGTGGAGLQPRTVIGQRKDGTVMFLVIDGRQISSVGATLMEAQNIMLENGAYNAANLDGGASSQMEFNGQTINKPCSIYGPRYLPSAFIVEQ